MKLTQYNAMPEGDTKLAVRLAITMGWMPRRVFYGVSIQPNSGVLVFDEHYVTLGSRYRNFSPFTDPSIPFGLIGRGVYKLSFDTGMFIARADCFYPDIEIAKSSLSKTHAIINAFCAADPQGHWARFMKGGEW